MKYISIILMSLFLVGNAYSINSSTVWKKGRIIMQSTAGDLSRIEALIEYKDMLYHCNSFQAELRCYQPKDTEVIVVN